MTTATAKKSGKAKTVPQVKIEALGNRVVVEIIPHDEMSEGGIVIPEKAQHRPDEARVVAVGTGKMLQNGNLVPIKVNVDDRVLIVKYGGSEVKINKKDMLVLDADSEVLLRLT